VEYGDRFQSTVNCAYGAHGCYVTFRLDYQIGSGPRRTYWAFREKHEGLYYHADVNLNPLAGKDVNFILTVLSTGSAAGDRALWSNPVISRVGAPPPPPPPVSTTQYDFGTGTSALAAGYMRVSEGTSYSSGDYGWTSTTGLESRDRAAPADALKTDFVMHVSEARTFKTDIPNGNYAVTVTMGDNDFAHDDMVVKANGFTKLADVDAALGTFEENTFYVTVSGGSLELEFSDAGGSAPTWVVNAVSIVLQPPPPDTSQYDFGTGASPLAASYTEVTEATSYASGGYGWTSTTGLDSRDRGAPADDLKTDFVMHTSEARTFKTDIPNGNYAVTVTMGDNDFAHDDMVVKANGFTKLADVDAAAGAFEEDTFYVTVSTGSLELEFSDAGGSDPTWVVNAVSIVLAPPPSGTSQYDFGTGDSPLAANYTEVLQGTSYAAGGYGWTSTSGLESRDRGAPADDLKTDFVMHTSAARTFKTDIPNGNYAVTVTMGDNDFAHDDMVVKANGVTQLSDVDAAAGAFEENAFNVTVSTGSLELEFSDAGGSDPTWVVNAVVIESTSPPPPPGYGCDRARFVADVTVPDGTIFPPGAGFTKTWRLRNVGTCTWTTSYSLVFESGEQMGGTSVNMPWNVAPGQTVDVTVNLTAPGSPGIYRGYWRFQNSSGVRFGIGAYGTKSWWVEIRVL
jgi:fibronectin type 3 domain-containing protein